MPTDHLYIPNAPDYSGMSHQIKVCKCGYEAPMSVVNPSETYRLALYVDHVLAIILERTSA
jgi:hypothetical protein